MKTTLPVGIYQENDKRFEFDFAHYLIKIKTYQQDRVWGTTVSPFRLIKADDGFYLLIHNYDRSGDRKIMIESIDADQLVINHDNTSYKLNKVA